jgi:hypothetical protein
MNATTANAVDHAERLSWAEICRRYPDHWVVVVDADWTNDHHLFRSAAVVGHRTLRTDASIDIKAAFEHHQQVGCFWTGELRAPRPRFFIP